MLVWSGRGILIFLVYACAYALGDFIFPEDKAHYIYVFAGLLTAIFSWFAGLAWNTKNDRVVTDDKTGEKILIKGGDHKLFWIPMQYWGIICTVLSIIASFQISVWLAVGLSIIFCAIIIFYKKRNAERNEIEPTVNSNHSTSEIAEKEYEMCNLNDLPNDLKEKVITSQKAYALATEIDKLLSENFVITDLRVAATANQYVVITGFVENEIEKQKVQDFLIQSDKVNEFENNLTLQGNYRGSVYE